jgi:hypothetical protein
LSSNDPPPRGSGTAGGCARSWRSIPAGKTFALHDLFVNERAGLESATAAKKARSVALRDPSFSLSDSEFAYETFAAAAETHALEFVLTAEPVPALPAHAEAAVLGAV